MNTNVILKLNIILFQHTTFFAWLKYDCLLKEREKKKNGNTAKENEREILTEEQEQTMAEKLYDCPKYNLKNHLF